MLDSFVSVITALWHQDFALLQSPGSAAMIYLCIFTLIWLESALLPAAPMPCDSVVILSGSLAAAGIISLPLAFLALLVAGATGSWVAFIQGRWLHRLPKIQRWIDAVPEKRMITVDKLLNQHGLLALFIARFIPVVRPLLPLMMGLHVKNVAHFHYFAWLSAASWSGLLLGFGYALSYLPENIAKFVTMALIIAPVVTLAIAIVSLLSSFIIKKRRAKKSIVAEMIQESVLVKPQNIMKEPVE
ncbi:DedA family protein [Shewanella fidelis]|uniref:DedA family protein n=1 Tax=Shewanella fidelis TaxID=173509 RepID=A0AAW8NIB9_9GAMM|nr:DedA family protein [Shewanella fidelis]MDR8522928.1 DedA family protein [Shewanella fidelis]MDW4811746.1 DedA family protein [Shewanella fidelis]MDW4815867.1 DedA family protein [Shewanella fidelis]MDW4819957.1 DedA family protein [Shewanella fidelis]MDW4824069.1 DedA family protein [Shewanella fidelis]